MVSGLASKRKTHKGKSKFLASSPRLGLRLPRQPSLYLQER